MPGTKIGLEVPKASGKLEKKIKGRGEGGNCKIEFLFYLFLPAAVRSFLSFERFFFEASSTLCSGSTIDSSFYPTVSLAYLH